ncbi:hypothetical protein HanRHA438_Chr10g0455921 [Helianthus annuus]|nr:hypothetical protein HanRHA438_Chr10g0455921 [Helianthus annuus]
MWRFDGALCTSHRRETPFIFYRVRMVKHKGCKDQVVGDVACMRMTLVGPRAVAHDVTVMRACARVHMA